MNGPQIRDSRPKLTKGEKCILAHLVVTIFLTIILLIIYLLHILLVSHSDVGAFDTRRSLALKDDGLSKFPLGLLYVNITPTRRICNTLLVTPEWSISAGHCVAMRTEPGLVYLLYYWRIKYPDTMGVKIIKGVVHPHFNRDTFANNIGLVQHEIPVTNMQQYKTPKINTYHADLGQKDLAIVSWDHGFSEFKDGTDSIELINAQHISMESCTNYVTPIIIKQLRNDEFCIELKKKVNTFLGHGATIIDTEDFNVFGIFVWGERHQNVLPLVALNVSHFKDWIVSIANNVFLY